MAGYNPPLIFPQAPNASPYARLWHYVTGTTIMKDIFADRALTTPLPQPLIADAAGHWQQFFLEPGAYDFVAKDQYGDQLRAPDIQISGDDGLPFPIPNRSGFLYYDISTGTYSWVDGGADDHTVKATPTDPTPGTLNQKIESTDTIVLEVVGDKLRARSIAPNIVGVTVDDQDPDYLGEKLEDSDTIVWDITGYTGGGQHARASVRPSALDDHKFLHSGADLIPGFAGDKIKAGTGITINVTTDEDFGEVMHINANIQSTGKVKVTSTDTTADYLANKLVAGPGMTITQVVSGATTLVLAPVTDYLEDSLDFEHGINIGASTNIQQVAALVLSPGTWELEGSVSVYSDYAGTGALQIVANVSKSGEMLVYDGWCQWSVMRADPGNVAGAAGSVCVPRHRFTVATTSTYCMYAQQRGGTFAGGLMWGNLTARKIT